jgi:PhoH-like ATPase
MGNRNKGKNNNHETRPNITTKISHKQHGSPENNNHISYRKTSGPYNGLVVPKDKKKKNEKKVDINVLDTSPLIYDPECIITIVKNREIAVIPLQVMIELDNLKSRPDVGYFAREAARVIESYRSKNDPSVQIYLGVDFSGPLSRLNKNTGDHIIMAQVNHFYKNNKDKFGKIKLISQDIIFRLTAREVLPDVTIEDYHHDKTDDTKLNIALKTITVHKSEIKKDSKGYFFSVDTAKKVKKEKINRSEIPLNGGVICHSDWYFGENIHWGDHFVAIRKNNIFRIIPEAISASNIGPFNLNINKNTEGSKREFKNKDNWGHAIALALLLDPGIKCIFISGKPGAGKTLLALAAAIQLRSSHKRITISRPTIFLEDKDGIGFLPGDMKSKMDPWFKPIYDNLDFLAENEIPETSGYAHSISKRERRRTNNKQQDSKKEKAADKVTPNKNNSIIKKLIEREKIQIEELGRIRGNTYSGDFFIIDEAQNLTPFQVRSIITRAGVDCKMVFTGDPYQIDRKNLDRSSSGFTYGMTRMNNNPIIAVIILAGGVRSELANLAERLL